MKTDYKVRAKSNMDNIKAYISPALKIRAEDYEGQLDSVRTRVKEMEHAFLEIQQPRPDYVIEHFVVGQHDTIPQQYAQCVLEMQIKYDNIRRAILGRKLIENKINRLAEKSTKGKTQEEKEHYLIKSEMSKIDLEEQDRAMLGALREFEAFYRLFKKFPQQYTRKDLNDNQAEYWKLRLARQANQDMQASGRVGVGNLEALRQAELATMPQIDHVREIEQKYLDIGDTKVLIAVPTEHKAEEGLPCLGGLIYPSGVQVRLYNVWGMKVADAYNDAAQTACKDEAHFLFTVEDDTFPPEDALAKLLDLYRKSEGKVIVGAWYPKRNKLREGTPIVLREGKRKALAADGEVHEVYTIPMGCTLIPVTAFMTTDFPWFATTAHLTQDSYFSQVVREKGYKLLCDTSIRCRHIDRDTGEVFE
jgi:hypothetical protein